MSISDLFGSGEHARNLGHFASIVNLAAVDGEINAREEAQLRKFAAKLGIEEGEFEKIMETPTAFPIHANNTTEGRLEKLHDLFCIIYSDNEVEPQEIALVKKYAIAMGFSPVEAERLVNKSVKIFGGNIDFDDYLYLVKKK